MSLFVGVWDIHICIIPSVTWALWKFFNCCLMFWVGALSSYWGRQNNVCFHSKNSAHCWQTGNILLSSHEALYASFRCRLSRRPCCSSICFCRFSNRRTCSSREIGCPRRSQRPTLFYALVEIWLRADRTLRDRCPLESGEILVARLREVDIAALVFEEDEL